MEEEVFTISITVSQPAAKIDGTVEIVDDYGLSIVASQQGVELEGVAMSEISQTALIAFGQWYKGDRGDDGVGIPQTLSLVGNELTLSDGGGTVTLPDGLPSQTGNAGKFLTTDGTDASWEEVQDTSFVCNFTITSFGETEQRITCDKSIAEIIAAAQSGKEVRGFAGDGSGSSTDFLVTMSAFEDHYVIFQSIIVIFGVFLIYFSGDNSSDTDEWEGGFYRYSDVAFSGDYEDLQNRPTLGTASALDVAENGNASATQVVKGDDTRLSDSRNAADVYPWAKANTKPSYTASEVGAIASSEKGSNNGVAELDATGKVPSSQLPSYVDDVLEYASLSAFPATGDSGKIYIAQDTNKTYRWSGSSYAEISESLALGETSSTAYAGNKGKANADAIAAIKDGTSIDSFGDVETALGNKQDTIDSSHKLNADYIEDGTTNKVINVKPDWNATSGSASEILNKPTIPAAQVNSDWNASSGVAQILNKPTLATVATSGSYNDLLNTPTIPDAVSGTDDGTNWTSLTIGSVTKAIPSGGGGSSTLAGLTDVDVNNPSDGQVLTYDNANSEWNNTTQYAAVLRTWTNS